MGNSSGEGLSGDDRPSETSGEYVRKVPSKWDSTILPNFLLLLLLIIILDACFCYIDRGRYVLLNIIKLNKIGKIYTIQHYIHTYASR